jgi:hypothetical protein
MTMKPSPSEVDVLVEAQLGRNPKKFYEIEGALISRERPALGGSRRGDGIDSSAVESSLQRLKRAGHAVYLRGKGWVMSTDAERRRSR